MTFELVNIVHVLIIWLSLMFFVLLLTPRFNKKKSNRFLSLILLTIGIHFTYNFLYSNGVLLDILPIYSCSYGFLYGPLTFFYVKYSLQKDASFSWKDGLHFLPAMLVVAITLSGFLICGIIQGWVIAVILVYCGLAFLETLKYKRLINQVSSKAFEQEIKWINLFILSMIFIILLNGLQMRFDSFDILGFKVKVEMLVQLGVLMMVTLVILQGLKNPTSFQQLTKDDLRIIKSSIPSVDTERSIDNRNELALQLDAFMKKDQPFLEPDLTLNRLSEAMGEPATLISGTIKHVFKTNFSDYINTYRVEYAKDLLSRSSNDTESIKEIMYDSGFNSRSVFNTVFKRKIGITPSQFRKTQ